jgi:hypothetical protein
MIRIKLITEGRVVRQISSRVHESVILEQLEKFQGTVDEIIYEGEMSEDAKAILQKVARRVIPAAMAAGIALGGANSAQAQNHFPGTNQSIGQHISDIFSPDYREKQRQRKYERETKKREWDARQAEIRRARIDQARTQGRRDAQGVTGSEMPQGTKVYDQARTSGDGRYIILYDLDHRVTRIPAAGVEFVPADSQRMAHYISATGRVYYVRHADHDHDSKTESITEDPTVGTIPASGGSASTIKPTGSRAPTPNTPNKTTTQKDEDDEDGLVLDKNHGLGDDDIAAIKKAGIAVNIKEQKVSRLEQRVRGITENSTDPKLQDILDKHQASWQAFKAGGDISDNEEFYDDLFGYFMDSGEMPYGVAKARDGDPVNWITNKMDALAGNEEIGEMKDDDLDQDQATAADQASADKNIIMQIRKAADYEKPTHLELEDGTKFAINANSAKKLLGMFDKLRPDSKMMMQQVLNKQQGIQGILDHLGESIAEAELAEAPEQYRSLNDVYPAGETEIWYWKEDFARDAMMGAKFMTKQGIMPTPDSVPDNYTLIGKIRETNPDKIFHMMQGEIWSPEGQANAMIRSSGTGHTSMSVGDIIHVGNKWLMVDRYGFHALGDKPLEDSVQFESTYFDAKKTAAVMADRIVGEIFNK